MEKNPNLKGRDKKEIRFFVSEKKYKLLKKEAQDIDIPLTDLIKIKLFGEKK